MRELLEASFRAAVAAADPLRILAGHLPPPPRGRIFIAAAARVAGIPARVGFADVKNHLTSPRLAETMGSDIFIYHGYTDLWLDGRWVKATPAFNLALCERFRVLPLEFDGREDSIFHPFDADQRRHMEYLRERGSFADVPVDEIQRAFREAYPKFYSLGRDAAKESFTPG